MVQFRFSNGLLTGAAIASVALDIQVQAGKSTNAIPDSRSLGQAVEDYSSDVSSGSSDDQRSTHQKEVVQYHLWPSEEIQTTLEEWAIQYPHLVRVTTSQEKYGLPRAGGPDDCPFDNVTDGCANHIMTIQDFAVHPEGSDSSAHLPEVFWSGCLHGNERVGPTATMEAAKLLLEAAACEALPRADVPVAEQQHELNNATACRKDLLENKGVDDLHRKWLARLVTTRRLIVVPMSNALGYFQNHREENGIDPNRDFPYDLEDSSKCMQTITGRTLNEIYREHMFQLALTFHGGMEVVGYEWGAPTWLDHLSPDDAAQNQVAEAYSHYGGRWAHTPQYDYGTMNDKVYYVRGGMEDWAYAGSFDPDRVLPCTPSTFDGYPKEKTIYNNSTLRVFNMLVETSNSKEPRKNDLGTSLDVMNSETAGNGHVSRNIRLALLALDLVEPYAAVLSVNGLRLSDDLVPLAARSERQCQLTRAVMVKENSVTVDIAFTVGGSLTIDETVVWYAKWSDISSDRLNCNSQIKSLDGFTQGTIVGRTDGTGAFSQNGPSPKAADGSSLGPVFKATIDVSKGFKKMDQIVVLVGAKVDQNWAHSPHNVAPKKLPQSHIVNARTDPDWHHHSEGMHVKGRLYWLSAPMTVIIGDFKDSVGKHEGHKIDTIEVNNRHGANQGVFGITPNSTGDEKPRIWPVVILVFVTSLFCIFCSLTRGPASLSKRNQINRAFADTDDFVFDSRPYSDFDKDGESDDEVGVEREIEIPEIDAK